MRERGNQSATQTRCLTVKKTYAINVPNKKKGNRLWARSVQPLVNSYLPFGTNLLVKAKAQIIMKCRQYLEDSDLWGHLRSNFGLTHLYFLPKWWEPIIYPTAQNSTCFSPLGFHQLYNFIHAKFQNNNNNNNNLI